MKERLFELGLVRGLVSMLVLLRGCGRLLAGRVYRGSSDFCWLYRVSDLLPFRALSRPVVRSTMGGVSRAAGNPIARSFLQDQAAARAARRYSLGGEGKLDLFRDLMVLKSCEAPEKGVLVLKYTETFDAFMAYFDVEAVADHYYLVLEPSWAGYCDPSILMYALPDRPVVVQCFTDQDYDFVQGLGTNLEPVRLGPADWISPEDFPDVGDAERDYDLVMIANWGRAKQHRRLFQALGRLTGPLRVLLIGFPWEGRTREDIRREARVVGPGIEIEMREEVPHEEVVRFLTRSKVLAFLSKKEGDNKAVVEGLFADVPAIVYADSVGGARGRINEETGILSSYRDLHESIARMVSGYRDFSPRAWALGNTGSPLATARLESFLRDVAARRGEPFTCGIAEKSNSPNLTYRGGASHEVFARDYARLRTLLREPRHR